MVLPTRRSRSVFEEARRSVPAACRPPRRTPRPPRRRHAGCRAAGCLVRSLRRRAGPRTFGRYGSSVSGSIVCFEVLARAPDDMPDVRVVVLEEASSKAGRAGLVRWAQPVRVLRPVATSDDRVGAEAVAQDTSKSRSRSRGGNGSRIHSQLSVESVGGAVLRPMTRCQAFARSRRQRLYGLPSTVSLPRLSASSRS